MKWKELLQKVKKFDKQTWIVMILLGVLLLVVAIPVDSGKGKSRESNKVEKNSSIKKGNAYESELEGRVAELLEQMEGVGKVQVMITLEDENDDYSFQSKNSTEVKGVLVVAEGAENDITRLKIYEAMEALFSIDAHKIAIVEMGAQEGT